MYPGSKCIQNVNVKCVCVSGKVSPVHCGIQLPLDNSLAHSLTHRDIFILNKVISPSVTKCRLYSIMLAKDP